MGSSSGGLAARDALGAAEPRLHRALVLVHGVDPEHDEAQQEPHQQPDETSGQKLHKLLFACVYFAFMAVL